MISQVILHSFILFHLDNIHSISFDVTSAIPNALLYEHSPKDRGEIPTGNEQKNRKIVNYTSRSQKERRHQEEKQNKGCVTRSTRN